MDTSTSPDDSSQSTLRPTRTPYSVATFSGYTSATSSLPGSGAVTPRTAGFVEVEAGERTALLGEGRRDIGDAEEAIQTGGKLSVEASEFINVLADFFHSWREDSWEPVQWDASSRGAPALGVMRPKHGKDPSCMIQWLLFCTLQCTLTVFSPSTMGFPRDVALQCLYPWLSDAAMKSIFCPVVFACSAS